MITSEEQKFIEYLQIINKAFRKFAPPVYKDGEWQDSTGNDNLRVHRNPKPNDQQQQANNPQQQQANNPQQQPVATNTTQQPAASTA